MAANENVRSEGMRGADSLFRAVYGHFIDGTWVQGSSVYSAQ